MGQRDKGKRRNWGQPLKVLLWKSTIWCRWFRRSRRHKSVMCLLKDIVKSRKHYFLSIVYLWVTSAFVLSDYVLSSSIIASVNSGSLLGVVIAIVADLIVGLIVGLVVSSLISLVISLTIWIEFREPILTQSEAQEAVELNKAAYRDGFWFSLLRDKDLQFHLGDTDEEYPNVVRDLGPRTAMRWRRGQIASACWSVLQKKVRRLFQKTATK